MLKKLVAITFAVLMLFPFTLSAHATEDQTLLEVQAIVDRANYDIKLKIEQAEIEGDALLAKLDKDLLEATPVQNLNEEYALKAEQEAIITNSAEKIATFPTDSNELTETQLQVIKEHDEAVKKLSDIQLKIDKLLAEEAHKIEEAHFKFNTEAEKLINQLVDETNQIAANAKLEGEKRGYEVICEWTYHYIAGIGVWIDPLRVVGLV